MKLALERASLHFDGHAVLDGIDLEVRSGQVLGLVGPNGSGKSSLINVLSGIYPLSSGRLLIDGADATSWRPPQIAAAGVARTVQNTRIFGRLTVLDNVRAVGNGTRSAAEALLEDVGMLDHRHAMASTLGFAQRRRLDLARALALRPRALLLDEPSGTLTAAETDAMIEMLARIALPGRTVIIIEHKANLIAALCPEMAVLHLGRKIAQGPVAALCDDTLVRAVYFGDRGPVHA